MTAWAGGNSGWNIDLYNLYKSNCSSRIFSPALPMPDGAQVSLAGEGGGAGQLGEGGGVGVVGVAPRPGDLGCPPLHQGGGQVAGLH